MLEQAGNIWEFYYEIRWIVIPTNIGWKKDGSNPMGYGMAKRASDMYPDMPKWYGQRCQKYLANTAVTPYEPGRFILFPTKPFCEKAPYASWRNFASIDLVARSARQLQALLDLLSENKKLFITNVGLPLVGCGAGNLNPERVKSLLHGILDDRFILFVSDKKWHDRFL